MHFGPITNPLFDSLETPTPDISILVVKGKVKLNKNFYSERLALKTFVQTNDFVIFFVTVIRDLNFVKVTIERNHF